VDAAARLLEACAASGALETFVLCTTTGVHGPTDTPAREDDAGRPQNAYETSKARAEAVTRGIAAMRAARLVIARPGLVYGPGDLHLLGWFRSIRDGYYRVVGAGTNYQHPIYIDDAVRALQLCGSCAVPSGRAFHLVGDRPVTMRELSDAIGAAVGRPVSRVHLPKPVAYAVGAAIELLPIRRQLLPLSRTRVRFLTQNRAYDGARARNELGFVPHVDLTEGLSRTVAWYRAEGLL
jgi:nucleoside-diphosphate-sugar epimerase